MAIKLQKNEGIKLSKNDDILRKITFGTGWDPSKGYIEVETTTTIENVIETPAKGILGFFGKKQREVTRVAGEPKMIRKPIGKFDLDSTVLAFKDGRFVGECSFRRPILSNGIKNILVHSGDDTSGGKSKDGDDERIGIFLSDIGDYADTLYLVLNVFGAHYREQTLDMVDNAYVKVYGEENEELAYFNLSDDYKGKTGAIVGKAIKSDSGWEFKALGDGIDVEDIDEIRQIVTKY